MIYKSTEDIKTELQWLKAGYILKANAKGIDGWNNRHCRFPVKRYTDDEVIKDEQAAKNKLKEERHKYYVWQKELKAIRQRRNQA